MYSDQSFCKILEICSTFLGIKKEYDKKKSIYDVV